MQHTPEDDTDEDDNADDEDDTDEDREDDDFASLRGASLSTKIFVFSNAPPYNGGIPSTPSTANIEGDKRGGGMTAGSDSTDTDERDDDGERDGSVGRDEGE